MTSIGDYAFESCGLLSSVTIPDSVTSIGDYAFGSCVCLDHITIPNSVTDMGANPFSGCNNLTKIIVSRDNPVFSTIDGVLFNKLEKKLVCFPCTRSQTSYDIPDGITSIGDYAFLLCENLQSVTIPDSVTSIGDRAFQGCPSLTSIILPDSVTDMGVNPFSSCGKLTEIIVSPDHPVFAINDGVLFNKPEKKLVCYPRTRSQTSYDIPDGITSIGDYAFLLCNSLTSVTIPDSVTSIGDYAFYCCNSLTSVTIPNSVTTIGEDAFADYGFLTLTVARGSWAEQWCKDNGMNYTYPDAHN